MMTKSLGVTLASCLLLSACGNSAQSDQDDPPAETPAVNEKTVEVPVPAVEPEPEPKADEDVTSKVRQADSHVHGDASLAIVLEDSTLTIELDTPLNNLTGFEHAPETDAQRATMENVEKFLEQPDGLFQPAEAAGCTPLTDGLNIHLTEETHDEQEGLGNKHDDHDNHEDNAHGADEDDHDELADHTDHRDIIIAYEFQCDHPEALTEISTTLMSQFPNFTEVDVVYLGPESQAAYTLNASVSSINLRP